MQLVSFIPKLAYIIKHNMDLYLDGVLPPFSTRNRFASLRGEAFHADILIKLVTRSSLPPHLRSWGRTRNKPKNVCEGSYTRMVKVIKSEPLVLLSVLGVVCLNSK